MMSTGLELHECCTVGDSDTLEELLNTGKYDVDMKDPEWQDRAPIHWACAKGYVECLRLLIDHGADSTSRMSMGWTPAHSAAETGKLNILRVLHTLGISVNNKDKYGDTPKRIAETYGHIECVKYLIIAEEEHKEKKETDQEGHSNSEEELSDDEPVT